MGMKEHRAACTVAGRGLAQKQCCLNCALRRENLRGSRWGHEHVPFSSL